MFMVLKAMHCQQVITIKNSVWKKIINKFHRLQNKSPFHYTVSLLNSYLCFYEMES